MPNKLLSGMALAAALGILLLFASPRFRQGEPSVAGRRAPEFTFELEGKPARIADLRGKVVVLNFWATWCPPCVEEMPSLQRLHDKLAPLGGMVLGLSVDDDEAAYRRFLLEHKITFPNHRDPSREISAQYGTAMYPETYILDRNGRIARKIIGPQDWDKPEWLDYLKGLLNVD
jgi:cytochrome c biogenesis protein CcmG/thiol:disulfide interchange protein DsbE